MKPFGRLTLVLMACCLPVMSQQKQEVAVTSQEDALSRQKISLAQYYLAIKTYTLKYAATPASCGDIADAAISACSDSLNAYVKTISGVRWQDLDSTSEQVQAKARRWAIQLALEAKYPNPGQEPQTQSEPPSKSGSRSKKK